MKAVSTRKSFWKNLFFDEPDTPIHTEKEHRGRTIFNQIVLIFTIGCIFGTYWEEILHLITTFLGTGTAVWESRRGLVYGPFSPVYGIGAILIYLLFYLPKFKTWFCFIGGALFGGALEYLLSVLQEQLFGTVSWDYSNKLLNINGRTTIPFMFVWGALVMIFARWACPFLNKIYHQIQVEHMNRICLFLAIFLAFDISMSVAAVTRQTMRQEGNPADKKIEIFFDRHFPDARLKEIYSNTHRAD